MSSPRVMVKSCVGGGREESFSEHPDAVRIFVCRFLCADFCVRIFCTDLFVRIFVCGFLCADFGFFSWISVRILTRIFLRLFFWQRDRRESDKRNLQKNPPQNLPQNASRTPPRIFALSGAIPRDYLSDTPLLRAMGFSVSRHGQLGAIPPSPFLSVSPLESMGSGGAIPPPPSKRVSQRYWRDTL